MNKDLQFEVVKIASRLLLLNLIAVVIVCIEMLCGMRRYYTVAEVVIIIVSTCFAFLFAYVEIFRYYRKPGAAALVKRKRDLKGMSLVTSVLCTYALIGGSYALFRVLLVVAFCFCFMYFLAISYEICGEKKV